MANHTTPAGILPSFKGALQRQVQQLRDFQALLRDLTSQAERQNNAPALGILDDARMVTSTATGDLSDLLKREGVRHV